MIERLETPRLILRRPIPRDRSAYLAYYASDWRATHGPVLGPDQAKPRFAAILGHWEAHGYGRFVVESKDEPGRPLGLFGPHFPDSYPEEEITGQLWTADALGRDIGYEAALATRRHAYEALGWITAVSYIHSENTHAIRLARRLGATIDPATLKPAVLDAHDAWRHPAPDHIRAAVRQSARRRSTRRNRHAEIPTIRTPRLILRPPLLEDFEPYAAFLASDRAHGLHGPYSRSAAWARFTSAIAHWHLYGFGGLTIEINGKPAGQIAISRGPDFPEPEIGWFLYDHYEGKGYATEAAIALREHAYSALGLKTLVSYCAPDNLHSIAVAERLGCRADAGAPRPSGADCLVYRHPDPDADGSVEAYA